MTLTASLRRARIRSGETLRDVARRAGVAAPNLSTIERGRRDPTSATVQRVAQALGVSFVPVASRGRASAAEALPLIAAAHERGEHRLAYRSFIQLADDLAVADAVTRVLLSAEPPEPSETRWDDAVAALVEYRLVSLHAPVPAWVRENTGDAEHPWEPQRAEVPLPFPVDEAEVAEPFQRRGVMIEANELDSA
ncbi:helix-turn-helix domain-containing protein [Microbacterium sp. G2-8]|uniref:helix-turn-helix domain-containing protein n=1 Tax=Microbacterium sp. G2-8 TaxID=2842454 RepID=UPI001C89A99B|nr:helix-turn-helix transcriptional regulator [Microbacterium sp. G2-8]